MSQKIQIKRSSTQDAPQSLEHGELAYSFKSEKLFIGKADKTVKDIVGDAVSKAIEVIDGGTF